MEIDKPAEINLAAFFAEIVRAKWVIAKCVGLALVLAVVYLHLAGRDYSVVLKVTPTASAVATLPSGISGIASIAGISLPGQLESSPFELYLDKVRSRETAAAVTQNEALLRDLFPDEWNDQSKSWEEPESFIRSVIFLIKSALGAKPSSWVAPNALRVHELLDEEVSVVRDRNAPIVSIVMTSSDVDLARRLLTEVHLAVDSSLREKELARSTGYVDYLKQQLINVSISEYRQALNEIIAEQEKRRMVASSNLPFAAEPVSGPTESVHPISPRPILMLFLSVFLGALLGAVLAISRLQWTEARCVAR
jgi:uncharacterized protein involved in exopolysaccharide biosynthesis